MVQAPHIPVHCSPGCSVKAAISLTDRNGRFAKPGDALSVAAWAGGKAQTAGRKI